MSKSFEDLAVGDTIENGPVTVTTEMIQEFAERYDPQPMHVDPEAAEESMWGGLIASGWHTVSLCHMLLVEITKEWGLGVGKGVEELTWKRPLRAGDELRVEYEIVAKQPVEDDREYGEFTYELCGYNQDDEVLVRWTGHGLLERRDAAQSA